MVALLAFISRATALIEAPSVSRCSAFARPSSVSTAGRPNFFSLCPGASLSSQRALDQKVFLELRHCGDDAHCHLTGWARQIDGTQRQAMNADPLLRQLVDGGLDVDRVATQAIQLRYHQHAIR